MSIRAGLLGAARIAPKAFIAPAKARGDIDIVAVGCSSIDKGAAFIADNELMMADIRSYEAVCTHSDIDLVYCALPPSAHLQWVTLALESGKAVLVEKPFSMTAEQARLMVAASEKSGAPVMEAFHYFFHPAFQFVSDKLKSGAIGTPQHFRGEFSHHIKNENDELRYVRGLGGGALMDLGCYPLHAFRHLIGEPQIISAQAKRESGVDVAMTTHMSRAGISGEIYCDMGRDASGIKQFEIAGSAGTLRFEGFVAPHRGHIITLDSPEKSETFEIAGPGTYRAQLDDFMAVISGQKGKLSAQDAVKQMQAIDAIYAAAGF